MHRTRSLSIALLALVVSCAGGDEENPAPQPEADSGTADPGDSGLPGPGIDEEAVFSAETLDSYTILENPEQPQTSFFYVPKVVGIDTQGGTPPSPDFAISVGPGDDLLVGGSLEPLGPPEAFSRLLDEARAAGLTAEPAPIAKLVPSWSPAGAITSPESEGAYTVGSVAVSFQGRLPASQTEAVKNTLTDGADWDDILGGELNWQVAIPGQPVQELASKIQLRCLVAEDIGGRVEISSGAECKKLFAF